MGYRRVQTVYDLQRIVGRTISKVISYNGMMAIHFTTGEPLFLVCARGEGVVWRDTLFGKRAKEILKELDLLEETGLAN